MYMFLQFFFASVDNSQLKMRRAGPLTFYTTRASVWVPSGVDRIVRLPSNHQFSGKIITSRILLCGSAISKLSTTTMMKETRK